MSEKESVSKSELRYRKIIEVGLELFLENGYEKTSLNDVIRVSGGSLTTIYEHFFSKKDFFEAVISKGLADFFENFNERLNISDDLGLEEFLYKVGMLYTEVSFTKKSMQFAKLLLSYQSEDRKMLDVLYKYVVGDIDKIFIKFFSQSRVKELFKDKNELSYYARTYRYLLRSPIQSYFVDVNLEAFAKEEFRQEHVRKSINLFLGGVLKDKNF